MSDAVAKLRFDLLANLNGFSGPMKEAADVADKTAQRFNRAFDGSKNVAARAEKEAEAWRAAMQKEGSFLASSMDFGGAESAATKNRVRWAEMLPWGKSARAEISKEAALTAAELGNAKNGIMQKLAENARGLSGLAAGGMGGMMDAALGMLSGHPVGAAVGAVAGFALNHVRERENYVRETGQSARRLGASTEEVSALHAAGANDELLGHLQRSIGEGGNAGLAKLGLDAGKLGGEGLQKQLEDVAERFNKLPTAVDKATVAQELFGKEGQEMIPVLQALKGKLAEVAESKIVTAKEAAAVKASDKESGIAAKAFDEGIEKQLHKVGLVGGLSKNFNRGLTMASDFLFGDEKSTRKHQAQFNRDDEDIYMADIRARTKAADDKKAAIAEQEAQRAAKLLELSKGVTERVNDAIAELRNPGGAAREAFGRSVNWNGPAMQNYDAGQRGLTQAQEDKANKDKADGLRRSGLSPVASYDQDLIDMSQVRPFMSRDGYDRWKRKRGRQTENELGIKNPEADYADRLADLAQARGRVSAEKLHRAAADAADMLMTAVDAPFMTSFEKFSAHMSAIDQREREGGYTADEARRRRKAETDSELGHAGIKRPLDEFKESLEEISKLRERGTITPEEFSKRERELRRQAISGTLSGTDEVRAVGAAAAGSREAYSAQVSAQLNSPQIQLAQETNRKLDELVKAARGAAAQRPIVAEPAAAW